MSTGLYLLSAGFVNLPPASTNLHPSWQQLVLISSQLQYFWLRKKPIPFLLQSVARQVHLLTSKCLTPSTTVSIIFSFARLNFFSRSSVQTNPDTHESGFNRCLKSSTQRQLRYIE